MIIRYNNICMYHTLLSIFIMYVLHKYNALLEPFQNYGNSNPNEYFKI